MYNVTVMHYTHGNTATHKRNRWNPEWRAHVAWVGMRSRCTNPNYRQFKDYGGRGINYDPAWDSFEQFLADMGLPPFGMTLDREDNDGSYCKSNCRWATHTAQNGNRRNNRYLEFNGEVRTVANWARKLGVDPRLLRVRLNRGWSVEATLSRPCDPTAGRFA